MIEVKTPSLRRAETIAATAATVICSNQVVDKEGKERNMNGESNADNMLDAIAGVLIRCFVIGIVFLTIWLGLVVGAPDWVWQMHSKLFHLSLEQIALVHYAGLLMAKVGVFWLFLMPYIGIKLVLRKRNNRASNY